MIELSPEIWTIILFLGLILGLLTGHPLGFVLGGLSVVVQTLAFGPESLYLFVSRVFGLMDNYILIAVPLFIFMAQLLSISGIAEELFDAFRYLFGPLKGGIAIAIVLVSALFGACTGIIGATVVSMGVMGLPVMMKYGYDKRLSCGVICAGGTLGILIPPSVMLVVMASLSGISVGKLFAGAIIPGLILTALYIIYVAVKCFIKPDYGPPVSHEERAMITTRIIMKRVLLSFAPPIILILGVLGTIFTGIATPTEGSGVGAFLAFLLVIFYGKFSWVGLYESVITTGKTTCMVIIAVVGASWFSTVFSQVGGGDVVSDLILGVGLGKWGIFIVMMLITFVLGMLIDWLGIVMIVFPIFLPIVQELGFDKLWFVVIMAVMLQDSFLTPPLGYALFYLKAVAPPSVSMKDIYWGAFPFWRLMELGLIICIVWPETITWLPTILVK